MATGLNGLGALALDSFGVSVHLSVCTPYQLASNDIYFREYLYWNLLLSSVEKIKIYLKWKKIIWHFTRKKVRLHCSQL